MENRQLEVCARLAEVRARNYGPRGKSRFARELGIGSSTYDRYERDRMPPANLLMNAARLTGTRIEWLITGEGVPDAVALSESGRGAELAESVRLLLHRRPELANPVESFLSLLAEPLASTEQPAQGSCLADVKSLIPVVGSTAAGPAHFWNEVATTAGGSEADSRLEAILETYTERSFESAAEVTPAPSVSGSETSARAALVQLSRPGELGFLEFISGTSVKQQSPAAVAWRIDGDSMSPRYNDGELVITTADQGAVAGHPCVARQREQIGVHCKLFQQHGEEISLIPINERHAPQTFPADQLQWACRVLYSVRLH